ncbi:EthD domain-containing protein [Hypoxylon argillaceum]|nr:EthD domain-containing protein [Hypoxylon argillaceum]
MRSVSGGRDHSFHEEKYIKLIKELAGDDFPISHTRRYIHRTKCNGGTEHNLDDSGAIFLGNKLIAMMIVARILAQANKVAQIAADESRFLDRSRLLIVGLGVTHVTTK